MLKHVTLAFLILFSSQFSFAKVNGAEIASPVSNAEPRVNWPCWGSQSYSERIKDPDYKWQTVSLNTDLCDRRDARPLIIDVYLKKISFTGSWDKITVDIIIKATHKLTGHSKTLRAGGVTDKKEFTQRFEFPAIRSGEYDIEITYLNLHFRKGDKATGSIQIKGAREGNASIEGVNPRAMWDLLQNARAETLTSGKPSHIVFGHQYEVPMNTGKGTYTMAIPGNLLIVPLMHHSSVNIIPHLLGDTHQGEAARCEGMQNARTSDGTLEQAELYTPQQAWLKLDKPMVAFNANYFDVRPQLNGTTWQTNLCSVPLGIYYDNDTSGPTGGTHNSPNKYFPGPEYFISDDNTRVALDALFWIQDFNPTIEINYSKSPADPAIQRRANEIEQSGHKFLAISGSGLPNRALTPEPAPDSGESDTTRLVIAPDKNDNVLYIFEGGGYRDGVNRNDLYWLTYGLGVPDALELDGGGSAALAVDSNAFSLRGDNRPSSSCNQPGLWCSSITQSDGKHRPVPSWIGLDLP